MPPMRRQPWSTVVISTVRAAFASATDANADPAAVFARKCSSCHSYGKGDVIGPDLKGVTARHDRKWLLAWISSSERLIGAGDPAAAALFRKYKQQRMPDQGLAPGELEGLLDYLEAGGPEADARRQNRSTDLATRDEIETGRQLFMGRRVLAAGGASCSSCHQIGRESRAGGSLGPDLARAWSRYHDQGLESLMARGCFPHSSHNLTATESFALRAFLRHAGASPRAPPVSTRTKAAKNQ
jgi:cytochrome c2